ncbi:MAG: microcin C ABC transporter permease YejB [Geminicoccaceae bacterium]
MWAYLARRLLLVIPTLLGIMVINFVIVQAAPGGPVDQTLAQIRGAGGGALDRVTGGATGDVGTTRASRGIEPELIEQLKKLYGFDQPAHVRFFDMLRRFATFDFGESFFRGRPVIDLIIERLPVSVSLGLWATLITYLVSIPLGIRKAVRDGSRFDLWTSTVISVGNAVPGFLFAVLLIVLFAGGSYFQWFPLRGLVSSDWAQLSWWQKIADYFWHLALPLLSLVVGTFASLTLLTKNSFLEEIGKQYVLTARAKGLDERRVLYGHVFRNAMLIVIAGFPAAFIGVLITGSLLTEIIFSLDGLGLLGYEAAIQRDYPIVFATLYIYTLLALVLKIVSDLTYTLVDPRIDFETR